MEEEARRMLKVVGAERLPTLLKIPATIALLLWAVEDSGEVAGKARVVADELLAKAATNPMAAVQILINLDGEEKTHLVPMMADAKTETEIARAILQLANETLPPYV